MPTSYSAALALFLSLSAAPLLGADGNPLLAELLSQGVRIDEHSKVVLPPPTLPDGLSAAEQRTLLAKIPENRQTWESLTRRSVVAPFVLKISPSEDRKGSIGRRVDLWFVAYGDLDRLANDEFLEKQFRDAREGTDAENRLRVELLGSDLLRQRGLKPPKASFDPRYLSVQMNLFEKVRVQATTRNIKTTTDESVIIASVLDPKFDADPDFSNGWQAIERDFAGRRRFGPSQIYRGLGSYVKATRLVEPSGALLIEYHVAFAEPDGWFHGANLLRSKLPIVAQDGVRRFRRNIDAQPK